MKCENIFCIYCDNYKCILNTISINNIGMCEECIIINLDDETIKKEKIKLLRKYNDL